MIYLTKNKFNPDGYWTKLARIPASLNIRGNAIEYNTSLTDLFDQNGYRLTQLEQIYADSNGAEITLHADEKSLRQRWFVKFDEVENVHLNHAYLFERKGYLGDALDQLRNWATCNPLFYKLINIRPKWGVDFSMDYVDEQGNCFEIIHFEYDCFDCNEAAAIKLKCEQIFFGIDWEDAAKKLLEKKKLWHNLDFFTQSSWKCQYFGLPNERFKEVIWK